MKPEPEAAEAVRLETAAVSSPVAKEEQKVLRTEEFEHQPERRSSTQPHPAP